MHPKQLIVHATKSFCHLCGQNNTAQTATQHECINLTFLGGGLIMKYIIFKSAWQAFIRL